MQGNSSYNYAILNNSVVLQLVKNIPARYRTRRLITVSLSQVKIIQSTSSNPISLTHVLIFFRLIIGFPRDFFPSCFPTKTLPATLFFPIYLSFLFLFDLIALIKNVIYESPHHSIFSSLLIFYLDMTQIPIVLCFTD